MSGQFHLAGGAPEVLARFGAISQLAGVRYWTVTAKRWQTLIERAHALDAAGRPRADYTAAEFVPGHDLPFSQTDNDGGAVPYRMHVVSVSPGRIILRSENTATIRYLLVPLFSPGELQSLYVLTSDGGDMWTYASLTRIGAGASGLTDGHADSGINRAVAMYRHIAAIPTDREPPAAP